MEQSTQPFAVVRCYDDAIDTDRCDVGAYLRTRDVKALVYRDGARPVIYRCRVLSRGEWRHMHTLSHDADRYEYAFRCCVMSVDDFVWPDGTQRAWTRPDDGSAKPKPIPDETLDTYFAEADIQEIGHVIWARSFFGQRQQPFYQLLDTSQYALRAAVFRRVERTLASSSSATSSAPPPAQPAETHAP